MKILFFVRHYFTSLGGIEEHVFQITEALKTKHPIYITANNVDTAHPKYRTDVHYIAFRNVNVSQFDAIFIENFEILPHLNLCIRIISNHFFSKKKPKVILVPHGGFTLNWQLFSLPKRWIKYIYNRTFGVYFINNYCHLVIAVSDWEKSALFKEGVKAPIQVIRNGYERTFNSETPTFKEKYFVFLGRIDPIKNIESILDHFAALKAADARFAEYDLKIIGDTAHNIAYTKALKERIDKLQIKGAVEFIGPKHGKEKYEYLAKAAALICFSHVENDPVVIKEAFSVGTKVIINGNAGLFDYATDMNAFLVTESINADDLSKFIDTAYINEHTIVLLPWGKIAQIYAEVLG